MKENKFKNFNFNFKVFFFKNILKYFTTELKFNFLNKFNYNKLIKFYLIICYYILQ